jgi:hypothetical protein
VRKPTRSLVLFRLALALASLVFLALVGYNMLCHSQLADRQEIGAALRESARLHAPVTALYILGGDQLRRIDALKGVARSDAEEIAAGITKAVRSYPPGAIHALFDAPQTPAQRRLQRSHYGAYLMLLILAVLYWRRPREVSLIRGTDHR